jgi:hypothetical protein
VKICGAVAADHRGKDLDLRDLIARADGKIPAQYRAHRELPGADVGQGFLDRGLYFFFGSLSHVLTGPVKDPLDPFPCRFAFAG